ncbi:MAG: SAM-dependent methyltransferase, partial [Litorilinea sp.]
MTIEKGKIDGPDAHASSASAPALWPATIDRPRADICIVGLGPGPLEAMTLAAWRALTTAPRLVLRTARHPCVAALPEPVTYTTFDALYEQHATFAAVYAEITQQVVALGQAGADQEAGGVVYAVPGHPWVGEATTPLILDAAAATGLSTAVVDGLSFVEPCFAAVGVDL